MYARISSAIAARSSGDETSVWSRSNTHKRTLEPYHSPARGIDSTQAERRRMAYHLRRPVTRAPPEEIMRNIGRRAIIPIVAVLPTIFGTAAFAQPAAVPAPTYSVGDQWRFTTGPVKVVAIDGDLVVREFPASKQCSDCRYYSDLQSVLVKVTTSDGAEIKHPLIGARPLDFPLSVGKEWAYSTQFFNEQSNRS